MADALEAAPPDAQAAAEAAAAAAEAAVAAAAAVGAAASLRARWEAAAPPRRPALALITLQGSIVRGHGKSSVSAGETRKQLRRALKDADVKAVVLRIDSGGGDAIASDAIHREVLG